MARELSKRSANLAGYATGTSNEPEGDEGEENLAGNCKQPGRNPVRGSHRLGNKNAPTLDPRTLVIPGGEAERIKKQATMFPA